MLNSFQRILTLSSICLILSACGEGESEVARNIKFKVSSGGVVTPTDLSEFDSACSDEDISGPRVRMRSSIIWSGTEFGNLYPSALIANIKNPQLDGSYEKAKAPFGDNESVSSYFGLGSDFIPPDGEVYSSSTCYLDWGGLPKPKNKLSGRMELRTRGTVLLTGVARTDDGVETPFVKEAKFEILYMAGSVPSD